MQFLNKRDTKKEFFIYCTEIPIFKMQDGRNQPAGNIPDLLGKLLPSYFLLFFFYL